MANVLFKQGLQENLDKIRTGLTATEGTFYLTTDTHRLYVGRITDSAQSATACDAVPVNQGVTVVKALSNLPTVNASNASQYVGQFYYVTDNNILCVYSASRVNSSFNSGGWVQINPNTDTKVEGLDINVTEDTAGIVKIETIVKNTTASGVSGGDSEKDEYYLTGAGGATVSSSYDSAKNKATVTITGEQYNLNSSVDAADKTATINLTSTSGKDNSAVKLVAGSNVTIKAGTEATREISITATDTELKNVTGGSGDGAITNPSSNGFHITVTDTGANSKSGAIDPIIAVGEDTAVAGNTVHFVNGTATLPVYSKSDIDTMLKGFNAMEFKGVITSAPSSTDVAIGDTYKVGNVSAEGLSFSNDGTNVTVYKGDLVIATSKLGKEVNGVIAAGDLKWEIITSGDDTTVTYLGEAISENSGAKVGVQLKESPSTDVVAKLTIEGGTTTGGTPMVVTGTAYQQGTGSNKKSIGEAITVTHGAVTREQDSLPDENIYTQSYNTYTYSTVEAITDITTNAEGHVTGVTKSKWQLKDTNGKVSAVNTQISASNEGTEYTAVITNGVRTLSSDNSQTGYQTASYNVKSSSLQITANAATIDEVTKVQTAAATMTIDMVWGTF